MNKKLIVCDIDDTILPPGKDRISERLKKDFDSALAKGSKILISSGRHYRFLPPSFFDDLPMEYIACINGGCLTDRDGNVLE
ncbi:MAG: HAD family hydrolase, partial [Bulleidia sp.]